MTENYFGISDTGKLRDNNEDAFIAEKVLKDRYVMGCVIDGVGGYEGGEIAARIARETIINYFSIPSGTITSMMKEAIKVANEKINKEKQKNSEHANMACVLTMAITDKESKKFFYAHVGDTRLYLFRDESLIKITKDQSFVGYLEDTGRLSEEEAMNHPKRNEINKALGFDLQMTGDDNYIEIGESPFLPGDILVLCSDGLSDMVNSKKITNLLSGDNSLEEKAKALVETANAAGGRDNITVVLVHNSDKPLKQKATKPIVKKKETPIIKEQKNLPEVYKAEVYKPSLLRSRNVIRVLTIICGLLLGALAWTLFRLFPTERNRQKEAIKNAVERKLSDTLQLSSTNTLLVTSSLFPQPVFLTDTLYLQKDSLYILGNEKFVLRADTGYKGPAIVISPACKYILLENMVFENFDVAILSNNRSLHLKNVQFKNCRVPVSYQFLFPDNSFVSGDISDSSYYKTDSLPQ